MAPHHHIVVFVSSVFRDMHQERDLLNRFVFPEVEETLRGRGHACTLQWVDLRWGLDQSRTPEAQRELQILQVCLEEIERSKPLFLCMLGQAYGTIASRTAIESLAGEFDIALPEAGSSITELEIEFALALASRNEVYPLFLFRDPDAAHPDEPRMAPQKRAITERFADNIRHYVQDELGDATHPWPARIAQILADWIAGRLPPPREQAAPDPASDYGDAFELLRRETAEVFVGRETVLARLAAELMTATQGTHRVLALTGGAGSGKTSLVVSLVERLEAAGALVLHHFAGLRPDGASIDAMLRRFCDALNGALGRERFSDEAWEREDPSDAFARSLVAVAASRPVICILDTLEEMEPGPAGRLLTWWPRRIAGRAAAMVTCRDAAALAEAWELPAAMIESLADFTAVEARSQAVTLCARRRRRLPDAVLGAILDKRDGGGAPSSANPLWVSLLVEELNLLEAQDFLRTAQFSGSGSDRIEQLLQETVADAPGDVSGLYKFVFARMERSLDRAALARFASLLALARMGLRPTDIGELWRHDASSRMSPLELSQLRHRLRGQVSTSGIAGTWRFTHATAREAALERYLPGDDERKAVNSEIADHLLRLPRLDPLRRSETAHHLARCGRLIELARLAVEDRGRPAAAAFMDLLAPGRAQAIDLASLIAAPELNAFEARELTFFMSSYVFRLAERSWTVASSVDILRQTAAGLARRASIEGAQETDEHDKVLVFIDNELAEHLGRVLRADEAREHAEKALERIERLVERHPESFAMLASLADTLERAGDIAFRAGHMDLALERLERCVALRRKMWTLDREPYHLLQVASALAWLGIIHKERNETAAALAVFEEALSEYRVGEVVTARVQPQFQTSRTTLTLILEYLLEVKAALGDIKGAVACGAELIEIRQQTWEADPGDLTRLRRLAVARLFYADVLAVEDLAGAEAEYANAADALAEVTAAVPDDWTAVHNFCSAVAALDAARIRLLKLSVSLPHAAQLQESIVRAHAASGPILAKMAGVPKRYEVAAAKLVEEHLLTALQLCIARFIWWSSRLRGERGRTPSAEAAAAALPEIGFYKVTAAQWETALAGSVPRSAPARAATPPVLRTPVAGGPGPDLGAGGKVAATALTTRLALESALAEATRSTEAGANLNAQRWREAATALAASLGVALPPDVAALAAAGQSRGAAAGAGAAPAPEPPADGGAPAPDSVPPPERVAAETERLRRVARELQASLGSASQTAVLEAFQSHVASSKADLGPLLKAPSVAMAQLLICRIVAAAAERQRRPIEAMRALQAAADIAIDLPVGRREANEAKLAGVTVMPDILRLAEVADRPLPTAQLHTMLACAVELAANGPAMAEAAAVAGVLATELGQNALDTDKDPDAALALFEQSIRLRTQANQTLRSRDIELDISAQLNRIGDLHFSRGALDRAEDYFRRALEQRRRLLAAAAGDRRAAAKTEYYVAGSLERLARVEEKRNATAAAARTFAEAAAVRERLHAAGVPDPQAAAEALWWSRNRTADLYLESEQVAEGLRWAAAAERAIADVVRLAPRSMERLATGIDSATFSAEMAAARGKAELWRAWMLRIRGTLRALVAAGAPLRRFEVLHNELEWSEVLGDGPPQPFPPEFARVFVALDASDIAAARAALSSARRPANECDMVRKAIDAAAAELAERSADARTIAFDMVPLPLLEPSRYDARLLLELRARRDRYLEGAAASLPLANATPDLMTSAHALYGLEDPRVWRLLELARHEMASLMPHPQPAQE